MIEKIEKNDTELAIIIRDEFSADGIHFVSRPDYSQQVAYMRHERGHKIQAHSHNKVSRRVERTNEVLLIKSGALKVIIFDDDRNKVCERVIEKGDVIFLIAGGHSFEVLDDCTFIEVKQGPYSGDNDKTRF